MIIRHGSWPARFSTRIGIVRPRLTIFNKLGNLLCLEPDPKVVGLYQSVVIQALFAKRWSERWYGLVLPGLSIAGKGCDIQAI